MEKLIQQAISTKKLIEFIYNGHPRLIEPHVLGVNAGVPKFHPHRSLSIN